MVALVGAVVGLVVVGLVVVVVDGKVIVTLLVA